MSCLGAAVLLAAVLAGSGEDGFRQMELGDFALKRPEDRVPTHLCVTGTVRRPLREKDGDVHVRLCNDSGVLCIVAEIIPQLPMLPPRDGQRVTACGITRFDHYHGWQELHPLLGWEPSGVGEKQ